MGINHHSYRVVCAGKEGYGRNGQLLVDDQDEVEKKKLRKSSNSDIYKKQHYGPGWIDG